MGIVECANVSAAERKKGKEIHEEECKTLGQMTSNFKELGKFLTNLKMSIEEYGEFKKLLVGGYGNNEAPDLYTFQ